MGKALEHDEKARTFQSRATNIEHAVSRSVFNDDPDAIERLEARIAELESKRESMKQRNAEFRKTHEAELAALDSKYARERAMPHPPYELSNLGGRISSDRKRLAQLKGGRR